ncbi:MAG: hypothetical protein N3A38_07390 [Planctomycetota bacterium]|nr:hypothetical protein [Planctomycetota bacterium]
MVPQRQYQRQEISADLARGNVTLSGDEIWQRVKGCTADQVANRMGSGWKKLTAEPIPCGSRLVVHKYGNGAAEFMVAFNKRNGGAAFVIYGDMAMGHNIEAGSRTTHMFTPPPLRQQSDA